MPISTGILVGSLVTLVAAAALALWRLLNPPPVLQVDHRGVYDRRLHAGWIPWDEIEGAYRVRGSHADSLSLGVRDTDRLWRRLRRRRGATATRPEMIDLPLELDGTQFSEVEILQAMLAQNEPPPAPSESRPDLHARCG